MTIQFLCQKLDFFCTLSLRPFQSHYPHPQLARRVSLPSLSPLLEEIPIYWNQFYKSDLVPPENSSPILFIFMNKAIVTNVSYAHIDGVGIWYPHWMERDFVTKICFLYCGQFVVRNGIRVNWKILAAKEATLQVADLLLRVEYSPHSPRQH